MRSRVINALLFAGSCLVALAAVEFALRRVELGLLPPIRVVDPGIRIETDHEEPYRGIEVDGKKITRGDLWGYHRLDPTLSYTVKENKVSVNGWWQSNNVGARSRSDSSRAIPDGKVRFLIFGESFAAGAALRQEEIWSNLLEVSNPHLQIVNLAVNGYSMAQAYLRYLSVKDHIEHDNVAMMFVPEADLMRDVNIIRDLAGGDANFPFPQPRFVVQNNQIKLVPSPYADPLDALRDNREGLSERLRNHLLSYDSFYFRTLYESPPLIGDLQIYKLAAFVYGRFERKMLFRDLMRPGSEATLVSHGIFLEMQEHAARGRTKFVLIILPTSRDLSRFRADPDYVKVWQVMTEFMCANIKNCIDLAPRLRTIPDSEIDKAFDGSFHYGPSMNRRIAELVSAEFVRCGLLP